ncbi:hypothetical protein ABW19_dt0204914 [Dactylella cylindrospora]|nr:hypothetical protein ABW19_dt0204914 [Dactylella cylindrospora]
MILSRVFLMFHHIRARRKRELIRSLAESMKITGVCKHGYPGFLYVEGEESSIRLYVKEIKRMKWQSVEVRRKEEQVMDELISIEDARKLRGPFGVVEVDNSKDMSEILRAAGLEEFLRKAMVGSSD